METITLPVWNIRLARVQEHETVPVDKKGSKPLSEQAKAAKMIRQTLKAVFPGVTFSVTSESFAGGDAVNVSWTDGPTSDMVDTVIRRFRYGHFDGMCDIYEYSNTRGDLPQSKYVHGRREYSRAVYTAAVDYINKRYGYAMEVHPDYCAVTRETDKHTGHDWQSHEVGRFLQNTSMMCPACDWATLPADKFCEQCGASLKTEDN